MTAEASALADLGGAGYLAMRPFAVTNDAVRPGDVAFELTLPTELPDGTFATFAWFDRSLDEWVPVGSTVAADARTITTARSSTDVPSAAGGGFALTTASFDGRASGDPASEIWTVVVGGVDDAVSAVGVAIEEVGAGVVDIGDATGEWWNEATADWSADFTLGSQWVMRAQRELLGTGADTPECAPDAEGAVSWVADTLMSDNAIIAGWGLEGGNAAVLLCAGPDPTDASKLQVRAAANRSYGFPVRFAEGIEPSSAGMDALEISTSTLIDAGYSAVASGGDLILNPRTFILPAQTYSFTVDEATVRAAQKLTSSPRIVEYPLSTFPEVLLSSVLGAALSELDPDDFFGGALGVFFLARDCDFTQWQADTAWTELTNSISTCLEALDSDDLQSAATDVARSATGDSADRAEAFVSGGADKARRLIGQLKWLAWFAAAQTAADYVNDVGTEQLAELPAWFVNATLADAPTARWEDVAGTWCGITYPSCTDLVPGTTQTPLGTLTTSFEYMLGECFAGVSSGDAGGGVTIVYCPAGAATPADVPGSEPGLPPSDDDLDFDRVFAYQGYGTAAWFRAEDVGAVSAG